MPSHRTALPQTGGELFVTDGGIETSLIYHDGVELPYFAAFTLLGSSEGREALRRYFRPYADVAHAAGAGLILESATWRASADWGERLGYSPARLADANRDAIALLEELRAEYRSPRTPVVVSGCIGPRGDGYVPDRAMSRSEAQGYHRAQVETFASTTADLVTAMTMNHTEEAIGVAEAARDAEMPVVLSFTLETDGRLPTGESLGDAIQAVDDATGGYPAYYMINCAHPTHFVSALEEEHWWEGRIRGLRANASRMSHAELDRATTLDAGDPQALAEEYAMLRKGRLGQLNVLGGCCGTDHRHVARIVDACAPLFRVQVT